MNHIEAGEKEMRPGRRWGAWTRVREQTWGDEKDLNSTLETESTGLWMDLEEAVDKGRGDRSHGAVVLSSFSHPMVSVYLPDTNPWLSRTVSEWPT